MDDMTEIKTTLGHIMGMLTRMDGRLGHLENEVAEIKGRLSDAPTARDFGRLEGRVAEMSERLPTAIAYQPPPEGKRRA